MNEEVERKLKEIARLHPTEEACGFLFDDEVVQITNVAKNKDHFFIMDNRETQMSVSQRGRLPDAFWHTHPNGDPEPSGADKKHHPAGYRMIIATEDEVTDHGYA